MADLSSRRSENPSALSPSVSSRAPHMLPSLGFSNFQFKTIGQKPGLLKRISAPNPDTEYHEDMDMGTHSPPMSSILAKDLPSGSSQEISKPPSLGARLSLQDRIMIHQSDVNDVEMEDSSSNRPNNLYPRLVTQTINLAPMNQSHYAPGGTTASVGTRPPSLNGINDSEISSPRHTQFNSLTTLGLQPPNPSRWSSGRTNLGVGLQTSTPPSSSLAAASMSCLGSPATVTTELPGFAVLRQLQAQIESSLANLKPINTENVLLLALSAKEYQRELLTSVHRAQAIAQQALLSAQESVAACQDCLKAAESTQVQIDGVMAAVENIGGGGHASGWNVALEALRGDFHQLQAWVSDLDIHEAQRQRKFEEETEAKRRSQVQIPQLQGPTAKRLGNSLITHRAHPRNIQSRSPVACPQLLPPSPILISVEHEADAAARAWDQQSAERRKLCEAELRKRRDAEERLEEEQKQAQVLAEARDAEIARLRAERIEVEQGEKSRQVAEEAGLKRQELDRMREKAIQSQLAQQWANKEGRRISEESAFQMVKVTPAERLAEEPQRRVMEQRPRHQEDRVKVVEAEAQRQHLVREQELKRLDIAAQKHRASAEAAKEFHPELAKEKPANRIVPIEKHITTSPHLSTQLLRNSLTTNPASGRPGVTDNVAANFLSADEATDNSSNQPRYVTPIQHRQSASANIIAYRSNGSINRPEHNNWATPPTTHRLPANTQSNVCIVSDIGNVPLIPRSLVPPISPEAQKVNLRRLIDATGSTIPPTIKRDPHEEKPPTKEENSALPLKMKEQTNDPLVNSTSNIPVEIGPSDSEPKVEADTNIPLLSLPSPSSAEQGNPLSSSTQVLNSEPARARSPNSTGRQQSDPLGPASGNAQPATQPTAEPINTTFTAMDTSTSPTGKQRVTVVSDVNSEPNLASLPSPPLPIATNQTFTPTSHGLAPNDPFDNPLASRMGPDASTSTNGWSLSSPVQEDTIDHRYRVRASRPPGPDHYSPPPPPPPSSSSGANARGPPPRSRPPHRRVDHYSPSRRSLERLPLVHNDYPRSPSHSGGPPSGNISQRISPDPRVRPTSRRDDGPEDILPPNLLGLKRQRVGEEPSGPPTRRPRYGTDDEQAPLNGTARRMNNVADEWGQPANFERSPTPEPQATLFDRIDNHAPPPISTAFRGRQVSNGYRPDPPNHRRPASFNFTQRSSQGQSSYGNNHQYYSNNPQRPSYRNQEDSSRPDLLDRFTDSTQPAQFDSGYAPARGYRGRPPKPFGRGGAHPPLEQRLSNKVNNPPLINRMQGPTGYQRPNNA